MKEQPYLTIELDTVDSVPRVWFNGTEVYVNSLVDLELLWSTKDQYEPYPSVAIKVVGYDDSLDYPLKETIHQCSGKYIEGVE